MGHLLGPWLLGCRGAGVVLLQGGRSFVTWGPHSFFSPAHLAGVSSGGAGGTVLSWQESPAQEALPLPSNVWDMLSTGQLFAYENSRTWF